MLLFVYGTLQDPAQQRRLFGASGWRLAGAATVRGALYDLGEYPGLVLDGGDAAAVPGVLIELEDAGVLTRLDAYEGVDEGLYVRREASVQRADGATATAWIYLYARTTAGRRRCTRWPREPG